MNKLFHIVSLVTKERNHNWEVISVTENYKNVFFTQCGDFEGGKRREEKKIRQRADKIKDIDASQAIQISN